MTDARREREIVVRALRAERVTMEEILRDETQPAEHKDDSFYEIELINGMLVRLGECPAVTSTAEEILDTNVNTPIRHCTKKYHEEGDHEWF